MILIADSGSTKCDWVLLDSSGKEHFRTKTLGLNPSVLPDSEIISIINSNSELVSVVTTVSSLDFYGAGCGTETPRQNLEDLLGTIFTNAKVTVKEDIMAAVYSVTQEPGIICILGTGSNSCYFDGKLIENGPPSLGFMVMDEASGNYFGKKLLQDYFYYMMPLKISLKFENDFNLSSDFIKTNLYKKTNPNAYLASFAKFIFTTPDEDAYFYNLLKTGISKFISNHILYFNTAEVVPIHFIGSIAHFSEKILKETLENHHLRLGKVIQKPMDGLIDYYRNVKLQNLNSNE